jgi:ABC transporter DrrB family efflux protein
MMKLSYIFTDALVVTKRNLIRYKRVPQLLVFSTVQPVMILLLFNYVFGGALGNTLPTGEYIDYLLPGVLIQISLFGATQSTIAIAQDVSAGLIERFRSLPMARSAVLFGRILADTIRNTLVVALLLGVGLLLGFRFGDGVANGIVGLLLVVAFGSAFSWISVAIGLALKDAESAQAAAFVWIFPLVFASAIFVPVRTMPEWLQNFASNQPVTKVANATREFTLGGTGHENLLPAILWIVGIAVVFSLLSILLYRRVR